MPIIKSAKKRVKVAKKATVRNSKTKRSLKTAVKAFHASLKSGKKSGDTLSKAQSEIDKATKKNVIHKNKAARKKSQLAKAAKASGVKPAEKKAVAAKTAPVKKTTPAKKPVAAKKSTVKKPATKKTASKK